jgi:pantoate--beta-alanine ligase
MLSVRSALTTNRLSVRSPPSDSRSLIPASCIQSRIHRRSLLVPTKAPRDKDTELDSDTKAAKPAIRNHIASAGREGDTDKSERAKLQFRRVASERQNPAFRKLILDRRPSNHATIRNLVALGESDAILRGTSSIRDHSAESKNMATRLQEASVAQVVRDVSSIRSIRRHASAAGRIVGLVPTMGALHEGHLDLVKEAGKECDEVVVSIYVNPTQFGANEDLSTYPRTMEEDLAKLKAVNRLMAVHPDIYKGRVTSIFNPTDDVMYPIGVAPSSHVAMHSSLTSVLEGSSRPNFFQGVSTVVTKLLNIVQPDKVYFGQKDIQQLIVVQRMINEFWLPTELRCIATRRHEDGLAMSSRNLYLGERRRAVALSLYEVLSKAAFRFDGGMTSRKYTLDMAREHADKLREAQLSLPPSQRARFEIDYLSLADPVYLKEVDEVDEAQGAVLSGAFIMLPLEEPQPGETLGLLDDTKQVRLLDNFLLGKAKDIGKQS